MHKPQIKFGKDFIFEKNFFLKLAKSIKNIQLESGAIPSNKDSSHDPWDHIEAIMGLNFLEDKESADLGFQWLKNNQNSDGSWYSKYLDNKPIELNKRGNPSGLKYAKYDPNSVLIRSVGFHDLHSRD